MRTKDKDLIAKMKPFLDNLEQVSPINREASIYRAMWYFIIGNNIAKAKAECVKAKDKKNASWKYNYAFLFAYEGNLDRAEKEYRQAIRGYIPDPGFIFEIIDFILWVLDNEPEKVQLHYCLGIIYYFAVDDKALTIHEFEKFIGSTRDTQFINQRENAEGILFELQS